MDEPIAVKPTDMSPRDRLPSEYLYEIGDATADRLGATASSWHVAATATALHHASRDAHYLHPAASAWRSYSLPHPRQTCSPDSVLWKSAPLLYSKPQPMEAGAQVQLTSHALPRKIPDAQWNQMFDDPVKEFRDAVTQTTQCGSDLSRLEAVNLSLQDRLDRGAWLGDHLMRGRRTIWSW